MARGKNIDIKSFCDDIYTELASMQMRIRTISDEVAMNYGEEMPYGQFRRHLNELAEQIEWRIQILSHVCPYDWKGSMEKVETTVSVPQTEVKKGPDFSPGYVGG